MVRISIFANRRGIFRDGKGQRGKEYSIGADETRQHAAFLPEAKQPRRGAGAGASSQAVRGSRPFCQIIPAA